MRLSGRCYCGVVEYSVENEFVYSAICHCSGCCRATGSAFKAFAGIQREKLTVTKGVAGLLIYGQSDNHDAHCGTCGSLIYSLVRDAAWVHVAMGTLVDTPSIRPTHHIFVGSKAPWYEITDDLPQYENFK